jgi:hypothetical protein
MELRMLDKLFHIGLRAAFAVTATIMLINAFYMLISPKAWSALPRWLRLQGVLTLERYGNRWGALQVRVLGAIVIVTAVWIATELLTTTGKR